MTQQQDTDREDEIVALFWSRGEEVLQLLNTIRDQVHAAETAFDGDGAYLSNMTVLAAQLRVAAGEPEPW